uniref:Venom factor n=1 Tax=Oncorhynchus kisutch TaxID=8019 RepID=A0A8C7MEZ0_ONCKI
MAGGTLLHILLLCVFCSCCAQIFNNPDRERFILLAPNILRTDSEESIYLESHGLNSPVTVTITVHNYPERRYQLLQDTVTLGPANSYHTLKIIKLPSERLDKGNEESSRNQYVYVKAEFGGYHEAEQVVMVSFHSGYIFIQTDKPLYKPGDTVLCRAFVSTPTFQAFNSSITIEFQNSDGVVVKQTSRTRANNGIFADTHVLPDIVNEGTWKIIAKFDNWQQNKFSSEFEVKKYVLPAFNVTLTPKKPFLRLDDTELVVEITARYLYGEDVQGTAYVMFGVEVNKEKRRLPSIKQVTNLQHGTATLTMAEIRKAYPDLSSLVGSSIYVKASVLTKSGSDLVEAEKSGIKIVKSPYVLSFIETPKYYKPGLPFDIMIQVSFQDGSPAHNVPVQVSLLANPITSHRGTIRTAINMPAELGPQIITAETKQTGLQPEQQARQQMTLHPYTPFDRQRQNYLYISTGTTTVSLGQSLGLSLHINTADKAHRELITHLTYLVLNKGKIIVAKRLEVGGQDMTNVLLTVTKEMMPSFRVVAFYMLPWAGTSEVVADSVWVDVEDACVGALSVGPAGSRPLEYYHPGRGFNFQVRGDPGAMVSLVVVDNAVFLLNRQRLTQRKIWQVVEGGDIGCTHGGGSNSMGVFTDAGLLFYSNTGGATSSRQGNRQKNRATSSRQENHYREKLLRQCCKDGLREIPMPYSCTRRSLYITEGWECIKLKHVYFLALGEESLRLPVMPVLEGQRGSFAEEEEEEEEEDDFMEESEVIVRSKFYESWLWKDLPLPSVPEDILNHLLLFVYLNHFVFIPGFCVAEPWNVRAWKRFFVDLKLPYSVARNEHVEIKAVLHNYGDEDMEVKVVLLKTEDMCSVAFNGKHTQEVRLKASSSLVVPYTIIPLKAGEMLLEVLAMAKGFMGSDGVKKKLRVVVEGVQKTKVQSFVLNPSAKGGNVEVNKVELGSLVPNSQPETFINIRGNLLADTIDNSISGDSLASLIRMPGGCVEQNLASITLPLIATVYLDHSNDWEAVGVQRRVEAMNYIQKGYQKQLVYKKKDDSYPPYRNEGTSTWITAYVVKVFSMARQLVGVSEQDVCGPLLYLLNNKQQTTGSFREDNPVYTTTMTGGVQGAESQSTLTAFVLIAMTEATKGTELNCNGAGHTIKVSWPHHQDGTHWPDSENRLFTLEATGYALLALVKSHHMTEAAAPFEWLNEQRRRGGGYGSTQPTMVVLQGLSGYLMKKPPNDLSLQVDLSIQGRSDQRYHFDPRTSYVARSSRVGGMLFSLPLSLFHHFFSPNLPVVTYYNELPEVHEKSSCKNFDLDVTIAESSGRALGLREVRMVVLDISLPTGFVPENEDLEMLTNSVDRYINNFQIVDNLSDRGSLIIHLFKVSNKETETIIFRLQQTFKVGLLQPSSVTVYEYYNPDHRCSRFYSPKEDKDELSQICRNNICRCTQGECVFVCICVWLCVCVFMCAKVLSVSQSQYDRYEMKITQVIKIGVEEGVSVGDTKVFLSHAGCRGDLDLKEGTDYLITGPKTDLWYKDSSTNSATYMLGKDAWVERWPTSTECASDAKLKARCTELDNFSKDLSEKGCRFK